MSAVDAEAIREREAVEYPLPEDKWYPMEAWRVEYVKDAYTDQLGVSHWAHVVYERVVITVKAKAEQFEYYGQKWYDSDRIGYSDDGRKWRWRQELVDYSGGGSWRVLEGGAPLPEGAIVPGFWQRPPYSKPGEAPRGYMLTDGTPATKLLDGGA